MHKYFQKPASNESHATGEKKDAEAGNDEPDNVEPIPAPKTLSLDEKLANSSQNENTFFELSPANQKDCFGRFRHVYCPVIINFSL